MKMTQTTEFTYEASFDLAQSTSYQRIVTESQGS
jgi:hypothetical protein